MRIFTILSSIQEILQNLEKGWFLTENSGEQEWVPQIRFLKKKSKYGSSKHYVILRDNVLMCKYKDQILLSVEQRNSSFKCIEIAKLFIHFCLSSFSLYVFCFKFIESSDESDTAHVPTATRRENVKDIHQPDSGFEEKKVKLRDAYIFFSLF